MNLMDFIFPKKCLECGEFGKYICESCLTKISKSGWYGKSYAIFRYEGVIRKAIIALKYKYSTEIAKELAQICTQKLIANRYQLNTILVPIPLHWKRLNERGFNQSEEVGRLIAKAMNWQFESNLLIKNKNTLHQVGLKGSARRQNLRDVFSVIPNQVLRSSGYSLVLFDDVMTTGSTLKEATKVLKEAGFKTIWSLTIAR